MCFVSYVCTGACVQGSSLCPATVSMQGPAASAESLRWAALTRATMNLQALFQQQSAAVPCCISGLFRAPQQSRMFQEAPSVAPEPLSEQTVPISSSAGQEVPSDERRRSTQHTRFQCDALYSYRNARASSFSGQQASCGVSCR